MRISTRVYFLTFIAYVCLHALRTVYSYSKPYFQKQYQLPKMYLAILDSSIYIFLGIGFLIRSPIVSQNNLKKHFIVTSVLCGVCYMLFPLLAATNILDSTNIYSLLLLLMVGYGFFQLNFWPTLLYIFKDYYSN
jgi:sugar phosphate permease